MMTFKIRRATPDDLEGIIRLFQDTIEAVNSAHYLPEQITVWKNGASKKERWLKKISEQYFLLAEINGKLAGFGSIADDGYLDFMYVAKDLQHIGVASKIYGELEVYATKNHLVRIISDGSITAKAFFERKGFEVVREQSIEIDNVRLTNYKMQKHLRLH